MKLLIGCLVGLSAAVAQTVSVPGQKEKAAEFFTGIYGCKPEVVRRLGTQDVVVSYPIFDRIFEKPAIKGRKNVEAFAERFCSRWKDAKVTVDQAVEEGNTVVLLWSFTAVSAVDAEGMPPKGTSDSWGGISLFRFDKNGKIALEVGEESTPGPSARIKAN